MAEATRRAGRNPLPDHLKHKRRVIYLTDAEWAKVKPVIDRLIAQRGKEKEGEA